jgi:uncharacterized protein
LSKIFKLNDCMDVAAAAEFILSKLEKDLPQNLYYHGVHHVLDVTWAAMSIASQESVTDPESLDLLKTAALYHDSGFMYTYENHEQEGCRVAHEILPVFGYSPGQIEAICGMIMATKIPQSPDTHLEEIICDADLDYLGRDDFKLIGDNLFRELNHQGKMPDIPTWNATQVRFLSAHEYRTEASRKNRESVKQKHLQELIDEVKGYGSGLVGA